MYQHKTETQIWNELKHGKGKSTQSPQTHAGTQASPSHQSMQSHNNTSSYNQLITSDHLRQQLDEIREEVNKICNLDTKEAQEKKERQQTVTSILNVLANCLQDVPAKAEKEKATATA
jgi:hypothetical protein